MARSLDLDQRVPRRVAYLMSLMMLNVPEGGPSGRHQCPGLRFLVCPVRTMPPDRTCLSDICVDRARLSTRAYVRLSMNAAPRHRAARSFRPCRIGSCLDGERCAVSQSRKSIPMRRARCRPRRLPIDGTLAGVGSAELSSSDQPDERARAAVGDGRTELSSKR